VDKLGAIFVVLLGLCVHANAQTSCPELTRLRNEALEILKQFGTVPVSDSPERCARLNRLSAAWGAVVQFANDNRESCDVSDRSLKVIDHFHREAELVRNEICAGRPFPNLSPSVPIVDTWREHIPAR
jgi:hypothetical protein